MYDNVLEFEVCGYPAWRVQHTKKEGQIYKGGVRFSENTTLDNVKMLAERMTQKCELYGLPFGGAKGAVKVNPLLVSREKLDEICRQYVRKLKKYIGRDKDALAPDLGTTSHDMDIMAEEFGDPAVCTGKSVEKGGLEGREEATAYGAYLWLKKLPKVKILAIQGFGNVGYYFAKFAREDNYIIKGITDKDGAVYGDWDNDELLTAKVDCLVLAACENQINETNWDKVRAKSILEIANGGISDMVIADLVDKGIMIVNDITCNSGGVIASYLEWKQNIEGKKYTKEEVFEFIREKMGKEHLLVPKT